VRAVRPSGPGIAPVALLLGLTLMAAAWSVTTPPGTAADETDHYTKALAAGRGDVRGHPLERDSITPLAAILERRARAGKNEAELRGVLWVQAGARSFSLPIGLVPTSIGCFNNLFRRADTSIPARCNRHRLFLDQSFLGGLRWLMAFSE